MHKYRSIESVFVRDKRTNKLNFDIIRNPAFKLVKAWLVQEKVDGMNIRVIITQEGIEIKGRTDRAEIPQDLEAHIRSVIDEEAILALRAKIPDKEEYTITLYGEGYGDNIQKGKNYREDKAFICFDILYGETGWLNPAEVEFYCGKASIPCVPIVGTIDTIPRTREDLTNIMPNSFVSNKTGIMVEGIVARPREIMYDVNLERIMWKLCFRDFY